MVGEVFFFKIVFLEKKNDRIRFELIRKVPEARERSMMLVKVSRSADRHCLRRDVGMGSRSEKELDDLEMIKLNKVNVETYNVKRVSDYTNNVSKKSFFCIIVCVLQVNYIVFYCFSSL